MHFEDILEEIGSFGRYQKILCFFLIPFTTGLCALTFYSQIFLLTAPLHTCRQQGQNAFGTTPSPHVLDGYGGVTRSHERVGTQATPESEFLDMVSSLLSNTSLENDARQPYTCHQFDPNGTLLTWTDGSRDWVTDNVTSLNQVPPPTSACVNGWDYEHDLMFSTYTSEHDFVCDDAWRPYMVATAFWIGNTIGSWIFGFVSDKYGRRPTVLVLTLVYGIAGVSSVFVSDYYGFLALRTLLGSAHHTLSHLPFVLVVEYCGLRSRTIPLLTIMMTYTTFSVLTPLLAWVIWDWKTMALVASAPALLSVFFYRWLPESSSWLIAQGKTEAAKTQLETVARVNNREVPYQMMNQLFSDLKDTDTKERTASQGSPEEGEGPPEEGNGGKDIVLDDLKYTTDSIAERNTSSSSIIHVVKYPYLRRNVLMVLIVWMLSCLCYYGHCQNTTNLSKNIFLSYLLGALVEIPSWSAPWLIVRFGRRKPLICAFFIAGIASLLYSVVPQDITWLVLTMALLGRASITGAFYITLQYGPEIFPTVIRGQGVALSESLGGVAIFISPSIVYLGEFHRTAPLLVFGGLSVLAGVATLLLPETAGVALPQTLPQAELFSRQSQLTMPCFSGQQPKSDAPVKPDRTIPDRNNS